MKWICEYHINGSQPDFENFELYFEFLQEIFSQNKTRHKKCSYWWRPNTFEHSETNNVDLVYTTYLECMIFKNNFGECRLILNINIFLHYNNLSQFNDQWSMWFGCLLFLLLHKKEPVMIHEEYIQIAGGSMWVTKFELDANIKTTQKSMAELIL